MRTPQEREQFAGSKACVECHTEYAGQLDSHHANTLTPVSVEKFGERFRDPSRVLDERNQVEYSAAVADGRCVIRAKSGVMEAESPVEWAVGSGNRGLTFVGPFMDATVELRISHNTESRSWVYTPGQGPGTFPTTPLGRKLETRDHWLCFGCHSTALVHQGNRLLLDRSILGVGCEACHGAGKPHIEAVQRQDADLRIARLADYRSTISTELCGQCHRRPEESNPDDPETRSQLARLQGLALTMSECFKKSDNRLSCVTCHNPHANAAATTRSEYNRTCLSCHTPGAPEQVTCPDQPSGDCVGCHMPQQTVPMANNLKFATHWIKVWAGRGATSHP